MLKGKSRLGAAYLLRLIIFNLLGRMPGEGKTEKHRIALQREYLIALLQVPVVMARLVSIIHNILVKGDVHPVQFT